MDRLMNNAPHIQVFDTSKGIDLILNDNEHGNGYHDHEGHNHPGHSHAVEPKTHICELDRQRKKIDLTLILAGNTIKPLHPLIKPMSFITGTGTTPSTNTSKKGKSEFGQLSHTKRRQILYDLPPPSPALPEPTDCTRFLPKKEEKNPLTPT